ncbi:hypothetical protein K438DRAFT_1945134 [Mycena galopus ATCC 62051]|nr:hypothetical protein K438DRAFT_1945134 [Mycena galopus ATCC 62051]
MPSTHLQRLAVLATILGLTHAQTYNLQQDLSGSTFFSGFKYNESAVDFNNFGNVHFLSQANANAANLTYVDSSGHVIIKVKHHKRRRRPHFWAEHGLPREPPNDDYGEPVDSGCEPYSLRLLRLALSIHPRPELACTGGIDIIENVNLETDNRFSLHVGDPNCVQPSSAASNQTGTISTLDGDISNCTVTPATGTNTVGCVTTETKPNSYGSGFANQGAGGIAFWYFPRASIPSNIGGTAAPTPATWGEASAWYPAASCDPSTAFGPQIITLYIDVCGAFAGVQSLWELNCGSVAANCSAAVGDPTNYNDAYWDINYLRVYTTGAVTTNSSAGASGGASSTASGAGAGPTGKSAPRPSAPVASASLLRPCVSPASWLAVALSWSRSLIYELHDGLFSRFWIIMVSWFSEYLAWVCETRHSFVICPYHHTPAPTSGNVS